MAILRPEKAARLGEILAVGRGMLLRYRRLRDPVEPFACQDPRRRRRGQGATARPGRGRRQAARPPARDQEPDELHAVPDTLGGALLGDTRFAARVMDAERGWAALLGTRTDMGWDASESRTLAALREESAAALEPIARHD